MTENLIEKDDIMLMLQRFLTIGPCFFLRLADGNKKAGIIWETMTDWKTSYHGAEPTCMIDKCQGS